MSVVFLHQPLDGLMRGIETLAVHLARGAANEELLVLRLNAAFTFGTRFLRQGQRGERDVGRFRRHGVLRVAGNHGSVGFNLRVARQRRLFGGGIALRDVIILGPGGAGGDMYARRRQFGVKVEHARGAEDRRRSRQQHKGRRRCGNGAIEAAPLAPPRFLLDGIAPTGLGRERNAQAFVHL